MSAAAARAEARKRAILARGTDRLAKLTTSARGEDGTIFDSRPQLSTQNFLGEDSNVMPPTQDIFSSGLSGSMPVPPSTSGDSTLVDALSDSNSTAPTSNGTPHNPSAWLPEQQQQFLQALLHASAGGNASLPGLSSPIGDPTSLVDPAAPLIDNPFAALIGSRSNSTDNAFGGFPPGMKFPPPGMKFPPPGMQPPSQQQQPKPKTILQKALPILHLLAVWCLLAYFVFFVEPKTHAQAHNASVGDDALKWDHASLWKRWVDLGQRKALLRDGLITYSVHVVPFFWAFTTLEIILHSLRFFAGYDAVRPPSIIAFALPHLPPPFPSIIINSLKYLQLGSLFLDDLSGIVVGIGLITYFSGWIGNVSS